MAHESMQHQLTMRALSGPEARQYINEIATIRITLFKEYPYLYNGTLEYEKEYLETYFSCARAAILLIFDGDSVVGFSNSIPLADESDEIKAPFIEHGCNLSDYLYVGEVMLYPPYRGQGLLRQFFQFHETRAHQEGFSFITFMTVERPDNHPHKPHDYRPLDPIWNYFGYHKRDGFVIRLVWSQIDAQEEACNQLIVWQKNRES